MIRTRFVVAAAALCLLSSACDFGRAEAERARVEAEMASQLAMEQQIRAQMLELQNAQLAEVHADFLALGSALEQYAIRNGGEYPDDLGVLALKDVNGVTYLGVTTVPLDPWGNAYLYKAPAGDRALPLLTCLGEDGAVGGEGLAADFTNLDPDEEPK